MELNDINKVTSRKRMNMEAENLRQKVSREAAKIIKLKVAQDTAYWDLKEKLQQVESNYEKLQQNMVEVQMQHESVSGQYQEELRLRPDTLNKLSSSRQICDVLEEYSERLKDTLSRCKADQDALCDAYQRSGRLVREMRAKQLEDGERSRCLVEALEERVKLLTDHQNQLLQFFTTAKQQADAEASRLRAQLSSAQTHKEQLVAAHTELGRNLDQCKHDVQMKEEMLVNLQEEVNTMKQEINTQAARTRAALAEHENKVKVLEDENMALKKAIENQDHFTKSLCEQNNALQEKAAVLEDEHITLLRDTDELKTKIEKASSLNQCLESNIHNLNGEKQSLLQKLQETQQNVNDLEEEIKNLVVKHSKVESEKCDALNELNKATEECNERAAQLETLAGVARELDATGTRLRTELEEHRVATEEKIKELNALIDAKDVELDSKAGTINKLMSELKTSVEIRSKLEGVLQNMKKEIEIERDAGKEKEVKLSSTIAQLEATVRNKDDELSKQMSMMLEMRNEKERLLEKIQTMQNKIDNIQKELTRPPPQQTASRVQPEPDDNAVMLTPSRKETQLQPAAQFTAPRAPEPDHTIFSLFSDSSLDGDSVDTAEVNRRFNALARGERVSPAPLAALKRRSGEASARGGLQHRQDNHNNTQISLSQVKNEMKNKERTFFKNKKRR